MCYFVYYASVAQMCTFAQPKINNLFVLFVIFIVTLYDIMAAACPAHRVQAKFPFGDNKVYSILFYSMSVLLFCKNSTWNITL